MFVFEWGGGGNGGIWLLLYPITSCKKLYSLVYQKKLEILVKL